MAWSLRAALLAGLIIINNDYNCDDVQVTHILNVSQVNLEKE